MKRKHLAILLATMLGATTAGSTSAQDGKVSSAAPVSGDVVKIGVLADMSGLYLDLSGPGSVEAAKMAVQDFGGKVLGKPIEIIVADHQNKPDVGASKARQWYDTEGVDMIVDVPNSAVALAVTKVSAEKKKIFIDTGAGSTRLTNEECNPYMVHYVYDTYALANVTARAIVQQPEGKRWFFVSADYAFGHSLQSDATAVISALGGEVVGSVRHPVNATDFASFLLQGQSSKAQIIGLANAGSDLINAVKAANDFGITRKQTLAGLLMFIGDVHSLGLPVAQGMMLTDAWYWDLDDETRKFGKRFFDKTKRMPAFSQAGVYSAVTSYLKAVKAAGTDHSDSVMAELKKMKINDVFAKNGYIRQDGRMVHDMYLMQVKKPSESKYPWDYYIVKAKVPAEQAFQPLSRSTCPYIKK